MKDLHAFGPSSRPRCINDVSQVIGSGCRDEIRLALLHQQCFVSIQTDDFGIVGEQLCDQALLGHQHGNLGILQHKRNALGGESWIKRHIRASCFEDTQ